MKIFKFLVPNDQFYSLPEDANLAYKGCLAVAVAEDEKAARRVVHAHAAEAGIDTRWLGIARVTSWPVDDTPRLVALAML